MNNRNKITISFLPHDDELWEFIQSKKETTNISEYVRNLIRRDMNNDATTINEDKIVKKFVEVLQSNDFVPPTKNEESIEELLANEDVKNTINSLF